MVKSHERRVKINGHNDVRDHVELSEISKIVSCKRVFKIKYDYNNNIERYKAQLLAKSFTQKDDIDYKKTFSPILRKIHLELS